MEPISLLESHLPQESRPAGIVTKGTKVITRPNIAQSAVKLLVGPSQPLKCRRLFMSRAIISPQSVT